LSAARLAALFLEEVEVLEVVMKTTVAMMTGWETDSASKVQSSVVLYQE
jgi:hypothetical protein